ncbi:MAG: hypothetical protein JKY11_09270 [Alphaproteobacteria bacterium]|nr:hypothetical protein [Alphaproteobacteria bacterium]
MATPNAKRLAPKSDALQNAMNAAGSQAKTVVAQTGKTAGAYQQNIADGMQIKGAAVAAEQHVKEAAGPETPATGGTSSFFANTSLNVAVGTIASALIPGAAPAFMVMGGAQLLGDIRKSLTSSEETNFSNAKNDEDYSPPVQNASPSRAMELQDGQIASMAQDDSFAAALDADVEEKGVENVLTELREGQTIKEAEGMIAFSQQQLHNEFSDRQFQNEPAPVGMA